MNPLDELSPNFDPSQCTEPTIDADTLIDYEPLAERTYPVDSIVAILSKKGYFVQHRFITNPSRPLERNALIEFSHKHEFKVPLPVPFVATHTYYGLPYIVPGFITQILFDLPDFSWVDIESYLPILEEWANYLPDNPTKERNHRVNGQFMHSGNDDMLLSWHDILAGKYDHAPTLTTYETPTPENFNSYAQSMYATVLHYDSLGDAQIESFARSLLASQKASGGWHWTDDTELDKQVLYQDIPTWLATAFLLRFMIDTPLPCYTFADFPTLASALIFCYRHDFTGTKSNRLDGRLLSALIFKHVGLLEHRSAIYDFSPIFLSYQTQFYYLFSKLEALGGMYTSLPTLQEKFPRDLIEPAFAHERYEFFEYLWSPYDSYNSHIHSKPAKDGTIIGL